MPNNHFTAVEKILAISGCALVAFALGCGSLSKKHGGSSGCAEGTKDPSGTTSDGKVADASIEETIRLKDASLLANSLNSALGAGKAANVNSATDDLIVRYAKQLGSSEGMAIGDYTSSSASSTAGATGYFLALNTIANNAALRCQTEGSQGKCACDQGMLERAVPYLNYDAPEVKPMIDSFVALCKENYVTAVSSLFSSVAFAKRY